LAAVYLHAPRDFCRGMRAIAPGPRKLRMAMNTDTQKLCDPDLEKFPQLPMAGDPTAPGSQTAPPCRWPSRRWNPLGGVWFITARDSGQRWHDVEGDPHVQTRFLGRFLKLPHRRGATVSFPPTGAKINEVWREGFQGVVFPRVARIPASRSSRGRSQAGRSFGDNSGFHKLQYLWEACASLRCRRQAESAGGRGAWCFCSRS